MKVSHRFLIGFAVVVLLIWTIVFLAQNTYKYIHEEFEVLKEDVVPGAIAMTDMIGRCQQIAHDIMDYIIEEEGEEKQAVMTGLGLLEKDGERLLEHETHIGEEEKKAAQELLGKINRYKSVVMGIIDLKKQGAGADELFEIEEKNMHPALEALIRQLEEYRSVHMEELAAAEEAVHEAHESGKRDLFLGAGLITLLAASVAFFVSRSIVKPLQALRRGVELFGKGDLDQRVGTDAKDEIGQLSRAFDRMADNLNIILRRQIAAAERSIAAADEINEAIMKVAQGDYAVQVEVSDKNDAFDSVAMGLNIMIDDIRSYVEKLKKMDKTKDEFLSIVTHDLKTPLASVYTYTKLLLTGTYGKVTEKQESFLKNILRQSEALQEMIDSILDFTRVEFGKITLDREPFSLNLDLAELIEAVQPLADQKGIALDVSIPEEEIEVDADKRMIGRVITNLLSNAVKYTPEKGKVAVSLDKDGDLARVSVEDNGIGIKKEHLDRLFDKFFMVEAAKAGVKRSLGLGLHIAKDFVEAHGGRIWAESEGAGKGSKFIFTIPIKG